MKIVNCKLKIVKRGFTLIEVLVAVFLFSIIFLIAASFVNLAAGQTRSSQTKNLTLDLRNTMDILNQKMNNANGEAIPPPIYGFKVINGILGIASSDGNCTLIGRKTEGTLGYLSMSTISCSSIHPAWVTDDLTQRLTPTSINVTGFSLSGEYMTNTNYNESSYIKVIIEAQDSDSEYQDNKIKIETTYSMDYQTWKRLSQ